MSRTIEEIPGFDEMLAKILEGSSPEKRLMNLTEE
jgi:hypothetical protein